MFKMVNNMSRKNFSVDFKYVTFNQFDKLKKLHPIVYNSFPTEKFKFLSDCPDISDDFPFFFYLTNNDKILSYFNALPDKLFFDKKEYRWAWSAGTFTFPEYRGRGLATRLNEEALKVFHKKNIGRGAAFSADATVHIYRKLGFIIPGYYSRYLLLKTARPFFEYYLKFKIGVRISDFLYRKTLRNILLIMHKIKGRQKIDLIHNPIDLNDIESEIDFTKLYYREKYHFNSSVDKMTWKLNETKHSTKLYLIKKKINNEPLCYFVIRKKYVNEPLAGKYENFYLMTLMDYGFFNKEKKTYEMLISIVLYTFWKSESEVFEVVSSSKLLNSHAKRMGMTKARKGVSFSFKVPPSWNLPQGSNELYNWHLTHFTGDAFSFP